MNETRTVDILVVGAGAAGLSAAIAALDANPSSRLMILTANDLGAGGCSRHTHGINAAMSSNDSWRLHAQDTLRSGGGLCEESIVNAMCQQIPVQLDRLREWGLPVDQDRGTYGGSSQSRSVHFSDVTGLMVVNRLVEQVTLRSPYIRTHRRLIALLTSKDACIGAAAINEHNSQLEFYFASIVVLATGGGACTYPVSSISSDKAGVGIVAAYRAGATLTDMEMVQFHPTGLVLPASGGNGILLEEEMRASGGRLLNNLEEPFMTRYSPAGDIATRDIVARGSYLEVKAGRGTENGGVWLDLSAFNSDQLRSRFPNTVTRARKWGIDLLTASRVEVSPTAHFLMGGIRVDSSGHTSLPGLLVCGEDAGGIHGANRLGGNGMAEALALGHVVGETAAREAASNFSSGAPPVQYVTLLCCAEGADLSEVNSTMLNLMWSHASLVRSESGLETLCTWLSQTLQRAYPRAFSDGDELSPILRAGISLAERLSLASLIGRSALARADSIGAHFREDCPEASPESYHVALQLDQGILRLPAAGLQPVREAE